jgi:LacI family transcriptional regulator
VVRRTSKNLSTAKKVSIREVADRAKVHLSTASRALDEVQSKRISTEVVERVRKVARELEYQPNAIAAGLRTNKSKTIGMLVPDIANPIFPLVFRGVEDCSSRNGYTALLANSDFDLKNEKRILNTFLARQIDGLILATARLKDTVIETARQRGIPVVSVMRTTEQENVPEVVGDTFAGVKLLVDHLHALGHRNIAAIAGPQFTSAGPAQVKAFREAVKIVGIQLRPHAIVVADDFSIEAGQRSARVLLSNSVRPTAIVACNDLFALGCLDVFSEFGLKCPSDISLTGYNDTPFLDRNNPPLTTIRVPFYHIGYEAVNQLLLRMANPDGPASVTSFPVELVVRRSTAQVP